MTSGLPPRAAIMVRSAQQAVRGDPYKPLYPCSVGECGQRGPAAPPALHTFHWAAHHTPARPQGHNAQWGPIQPSIRTLDGSSTKTGKKQWSDRTGSQDVCLLFQRTLGVSVVSVCVPLCSDGLCNCVCVLVPDWPEYCVCSCRGRRVWPPVSGVPPRGRAGRTRLGGEWSHLHCMCGLSRPDV